MSSVELPLHSVELPGANQANATTKMVATTRSAVSIELIEHLGSVQVSLDSHLMRTLLQVRLPWRVRSCVSKASDFVYSVLALNIKDPLFEHVMKMPFRQPAVTMDLRMVPTLLTVS